MHTLLVGLMCGFQVSDGEITQLNRPEGLHNVPAVLSLRIVVVVFQEGTDGRELSQFELDWILDTPIVSGSSCEEGIMCLSMIEGDWKCWEWQKEFQRGTGLILIQMSGPRVCC